MRLFHQNRKNNMHCRNGEGDGRLSVCWEGEQRRLHDVNTREPREKVISENLLQTGQQLPIQCYVNM